MRAKSLALVAALLVTLAACGSDGGPSGAQTTPSPQATTTASPMATTEVELWYSRGDHLFVTHREIPSASGIGAATLRTWIEGPTPEETQAGVATAVPDDTELLGLNIDDGVATVDLSSEFEEPSGTFGESMRLAQLVWTITQFPTVEGMLLKIDGATKDSYFSHGFVIDEPLKRRNREPLLPAIVVERPGIGDEVSSPVTISGTANVFEATVSLRILDASGNEIFRGFTTATCGSGCRGDFSEEVSFEISERQDGTIEAFEESAEDGSPLHVVSIPVTLVP